MFCEQSVFMRCNFFLSQRGITLFTVSHRKSLWKHHEVRKSECVSNMSIIVFLCSTFFSSMVVEHTSTRLSIPQLKSSDPKTDYNSCFSYSSVINILLLYCYYIILAVISIYSSIIRARMDQVIHIVMC